MELVDDDDVEVVRCQLFQASDVEGLDACEYVVPGLWLLAAIEQFSEGGVIEDLLIHAQGLLEDLLAVGHEQQSRMTVARLFGQGSVVQGSHHGLTSAGGCD